MKVTLIFLIPNMFFAPTTPYSHSCNCLLMFLDSECCSAHFPNLFVFSRRDTQCPNRERAINANHVSIKCENTNEGKILKMQKIMTKHPFIITEQKRK